MTNPAPRRSTKRFSKRLPASSFASLALSLALLAICGCGATRSNDLAGVHAEEDSRLSRPAPLVEAYLSAFNKHSAEAMAGLMHDAIEVYYDEDQGAAGLGTSGRAAMKEELEGYFGQFPDVASVAEGHVVVNGRYRSYTERVSWTSEGQSRTQSSLAVLEFEGDLLRRVWYYPTQS